MSIATSKQNEDVKIRSTLKEMIIVLTKSPFTFEFRLLYIALCKKLLMSSEEELLALDSLRILLIKKISQAILRKRKEIFLVANMEKVREICAAGHSIRNQANIHSRQPLKEMQVIGKNLFISPENATQEEWK